MNDDTSFTDDYAWTNTGATTAAVNFTVSTDGSYIANYTRYQIIPDKNWMPYRHFEYIPKWHQKFARYKLQMQSMWD